MMGRNPNAGKPGAKNPGRTLKRIFAEIAVTQLFAFAHMSKYFSGITALGRIDYLFIFAIAFVMAFYTAMPVQAAVDALTDAFGHRRVLAPTLSTAFNAALLALMLAFNFVPSATISAITQRAFWIFPVFAAGAPLLLLALSPVLNKRRERHAR